MTVSYHKTTLSAISQTLRLSFVPYDQAGQSHLTHNMNTHYDWIIIAEQKWIMSGKKIKITCISFSPLWEKYDKMHKVNKTC